MMEGGGNKLQGGEPVGGGGQGWGSGNWKLGPVRGAGADGMS